MTSDEFNRLKAKYVEVVGANPRGPKAKDPEWLRFQLEKLGVAVTEDDVAPAPPTPPSPRCLAVLPEDAPPGHHAHLHVIIMNQNVNPYAKFYYKDAHGERQSVQVTTHRSFSHYSALRIARRCYMMLHDEGKSRDETLRFRDDMYAKLREAKGLLSESTACGRLKLPGDGAPAASPLKAASSSDGSPQARSTAASPLGAAASAPPRPPGRSPLPPPHRPLPKLPPPPLSKEQEAELKRFTQKFCTAIGKGPRGPLARSVPWLKQKIAEVYKHKCNYCGDSFPTNAELSAHRDACEARAAALRESQRARTERRRERRQRARAERQAAAGDKAEGKVSKKKGRSEKKRKRGESKGHSGARWREVRTAAGWECYKCGECWLDRKVMRAHRRTCEGSLHLTDRPGGVPAAAGGGTAGASAGKRAVRARAGAASPGKPAAGGAAVGGAPGGTVDDSDNLMALLSEKKEDSDSDSDTESGSDSEGADDGSDSDSGGTGDDSDSDSDSEDEPRTGANSSDGVSLAAAKASNLPPGWEELWSEDYGIPYFYNSVTEESCWERPT